MVIAWIGYCLLIAALLSIAALAGERALHPYRKPVRWVWAGAMAGSVLVPIAAFLVPAAVRELWPAASGVSLSLAELRQLVVTPGATAEAAASATGSGLLDVFSSAAAWLWAGSVVLLGGYLTGTYRRLRAEMSDWTPGEILDAPVLMSKNRGPAVVGLRGGVIVMPQWIAELEESLLRLIFLHEREHQRAGDHRLFALALGSIVLMPWNLFLWWQLRRLRLAIEYDCDRRVIGRGVSPRDYADALLAVGERVSSAPFAAAAFAEPRSAVERRLRRMTEPLRRLRGPRAALAAGVGTLALIFACGSPIPTDAGADADVASAEEVAEVAENPAAELAPPPAGGTAADRPSFLPYDRPPVVQNRDEIVEVLREAYPADLKDAGVGGSVELWLYIDEEGNVANHEVQEASGHPELDAAAGEVAERMRFSPALNRDQPTPVWVTQIITFQPDASPDEPDRRPLTSGGTVTPMESKPLIAIDGVIQPQDVGMDDLGELSIDRIEVIKGGAALELYGDRARNGVIQVFTGDGEPATTLEPARIRELEPTRTPDSDLGVLERGSDRVVITAAGAEHDYLVVVDGVIQADDVEMGDLRALDIDHVEILRGEAALDRYGERARDGVIEITTKNG